MIDEIIFLWLAFVTWALVLVLFLVRRQDRINRRLQFRIDVALESATRGIEKEMNQGKNRGENDLRK